MSVVGGQSTHLTAAEIAELRLPGLPTSKKGVGVRADAEGWPFELRAVRGGEARFYEVAGLPKAARAALMPSSNIADQGAKTMGRPKGSDWFTTHPNVADAVLVILADQQRSARTIMKLLATEFSGLPDLRSLQRFMVQLVDDLAHHGGRRLGEPGYPQLFADRLQQGPLRPDRLCGDIGGAGARGDKAGGHRLAVTREAVEQPDPGRTFRAGLFAFHDRAQSERHVGERSVAAWLGRGDIHWFFSIRARELKGGCHAAPCRRSVAALGAEAGEPKATTIIFSARYSAVVA